MPHEGEIVVGAWVPKEQVQAFLDATECKEPDYACDNDIPYEKGSHRLYAAEYLGIDLSDAAMAALGAHYFERGSSSRCDLSTWQDDGGLWVVP